MFISGDALRWVVAATANFLASWGISSPIPSGEGRSLDDQKLMTAFRAVGTAETRIFPTAYLVRDSKHWMHPMLSVSKLTLQNLCLHTTLTRGIVMVIFSRNLHILATCEGNLIILDTYLT